MATVTSADFSQRHYACADLVRIDFNSASELAILLEIWEGGGVVQTSFPIAAGSPIAIAVEKTQVTAEVTKCETDHDFGYLIDIDVNAPAKWFPRAYVPAWHRPAVESTVSAGDCLSGAHAASGMAGSGMAAVITGIERISEPISPIHQS